MTGQTMPASFHAQDRSVSLRANDYQRFLSSRRAGCSGRSHQSCRRAFRECRAQTNSTSGTAPTPDPFATKEIYNDGPFERFMVSYFAKKMSEQLGGRTYAPGYEGFVELSREIMKGRNSKQQQQAVSGVLGSLMPEEAAVRFRRWFPVSKWSAETNATITALFFKWLVGPLETKDVEVEFEGRKQTWRSGVQIKKCRYLEQSGCLGMCINMCKIPTEDFFTNQFGLPLTMNPNLEDLSCEMIFGQRAPPLELDPVYNAPCFAHECSLALREPTPCPKIDTERGAKARRQQQARSVGGVAA